MKAQRKSIKIKIPPSIDGSTTFKKNVSANFANWSVIVDPSTGLAQVSGVSDFVLKETA